MKNLKITDVRAMAGDSAFLIDDGTTSILYDTGFAFTGYEVAENIKKELGDRSLDYIFLTHSHYDHALGSVYVAKRYPQAKVVAGEYAQKIFSKPTARAVMRDLDKKFAEKCGVHEYEDLIDELKVDICVQDGDEIMAGDMKFTAINLPGHTKCSVGYYLAENKLLLATETLGVYCGNGTILPSYLVGYGMTLESIEKAEKLEIDNILLPHFGLIDKEQTDSFLAKSKKIAIDTAEEIKKILSSGGSNEDAVEYFTKKFYNDDVKIVYPVDAFNLNTNITVNLIKTELM